jgi:hypothetical protein
MVYGDAEGSIKPPFNPLYLSSDFAASLAKRYCAVTHIYVGFALDV